MIWKSSLSATRGHAIGGNNVTLNVAINVFKYNNFKNFDKL